MPAKNSTSIIIMCTIKININHAKFYKCITKAVNDKGRIKKPEDISSGFRAVCSFWGQISSSAFSEASSMISRNPTMKPVRQPRLAVEQVFSYRWKQ